jgi:hypothetical protein
MNDYSGGIIMKDKIKSFQQEGLASQASYRSGAQKGSLLQKLPRMVFLSLLVLGVLSWLWH